MSKYFNDWLEDKITNEAGGFFSKLFGTSDPKIIASDFIRYMQRNGIKWDASNSQANISLVDLINAIINGRTATNILWKNVTDGVKQEQGKDIVSPQDIRMLYTSAYQEDKSKFPVHPRFQIEPSFDDFSKQYTINYKPKNVKPGIKTILTKEEQVEINDVVTNFTRFVGLTNWSIDIGEILGNLIGIWYFDKRVKWHEMLKTVYSYYYKSMIRNKKRPLSAEKFVQGITGYYEINPHITSEIFIQAREIDDKLKGSPPPPPPQGPTAQSSPFGDEAVLATYLSHVPKRIIDPSLPRTNTDYITVDDLKKISKSSPEWHKIMNVISSIFGRKSGEMAKFMNALIP